MFEDPAYAHLDTDSDSVHSDGGMTEAREVSPGNQRALCQSQSDVEDDVNGAAVPSKYPNYPVTL